MHCLFTKRIGLLEREQEKSLSVDRSKAFPARVNALGDNILICYCKYKIDIFQVCIVNDPREENSYNKLYTVDYLGNMTGGKPVLYINKPSAFLKEIAIKVLTESKEVSLSIIFCRCFPYLMFASNEMAEWENFRNLVYE